MRLLRYSVLLIGLFVVLIAAAMFFVGHRTNAPLVSLLFTNPDGSQCDKCLFGVAPDKVGSYSEFKSILMQHSFLTGLLFSGDADVVGDRFILGFSTDIHINNYVYVEVDPDIELRPSNVMLIGRVLRYTTLNDFITLWKLPDYVEYTPNDCYHDIYCKSGLLSLFYLKNQSIVLFVVPDGKTITTDNTLVQIEFMSINSVIDQIKKCVILGFKPETWHGFGAVDLYESAPCPRPTETP